MDKIKVFVKNLFTLENSIRFLGVFIAVIVAYFGIKNENTNQVISAILAIVGALALAQIIAEVGSSKTKKSIEHIEHMLQVSSTYFMTRDQLDSIVPFEKFLETGQDILIVGTSLLGTVGPRREFFRELAEKGACIRFLLQNPNASYIEVSAHTHGVSADTLQKDIHASLGHVQKLVNKKYNKGLIQFKFLTTIPNMSFIMRDGDKPSGEIRCELYLYQIDTTKRFTFCLTPSNGSIYERYKESIEKLWKDAVDIEQNG